MDFFCCFANAFWTSDKWIIFLLYSIAFIYYFYGNRVTSCWPVLTFFLIRIFNFIVFNSELFQPRINCDGQFFLAPNRMEEKWNDFDMKQMLKYIHWKVPLYLDEKLSISPSMWYWKREWRSTLSIQPCIEGKIDQGFMETEKSHWLVIQKSSANF